MKPKVALFIFVTLFLINLLSACGSGESSSSTNNPPTSKNWYKPAPSTTWQWQLSGIVNTAYAVELYDIDLFGSSKTLIQTLQSNNSKVICYFSAGSFEKGREDESDFKANELGSVLVDWPDERWLDIRSTNVRNIMKARLELAKQKGCDGVEPDNMDGYDNSSSFPLTADDQLNYNRFIAKESHARGLSVGLKNDLGQITELVDDFDFAVNEECFEFNECNALKPFIDQGKAVLNAEYKQTYINNLVSICNQSINLQFSTLLLPLDLDDSFRHSCL